MLRRLWEKKYSVHGRRKPTEAARRAGLHVGQGQVARLTHTDGMPSASRAKKRFTTKADPAHTREPDPVQRNLTAAGPDTLWVTDCTCCSTWSGILYVAFLVVESSRRSLGWKAVRTMHTSLVLDALTGRLDPASSRPGTGWSATPTRGQYTSITYTERLASIGAAPSIGTIGDSFDHAMAESTIGPSKTGLHRNPAALATSDGPWRGLDDLKIATCAWVS